MFIRQDLVWIQVRESPGVVKDSQVAHWLPSTGSEVFCLWARLVSDNPAELALCSYGGKFLLNLPPAPNLLPEAISICPIARTEAPGKCFKRAQQLLGSFTAGVVHLIECRGFQSNPNSCSITKLTGALGILMSCPKGPLAMMDEVQILRLFT